MKTEIYFSTDIETTGPIPGSNSMISLGSVAMQRDGKHLSTFEMNLNEIHGSTRDKDTMKFWGKNPEAWEYCTTNAVHPLQVMNKFVAWVEKVSKENNAKPVFVAYPAGFDFMFTYWYMIRFVGRSPFGFSCIDMKTYAMSLLGDNYRNISKKTMPKSWFDYSLPHNHTPLDDAIEQGYTFIQMLNERERVFGQIETFSLQD